MDVAVEAWAGGVSAAAALVAREAARARAEEASLAKRARAAAARGAAAAAEERAVAARLAGAWYAGLPFLGTKLSARPTARMAQAARVRAAAEAEWRAIAEPGRTVRSERAKLDALAPRLDLAGQAASRLGAVPSAVSVRAEAAASRAQHLRSLATVQRPEVLECCEELIAVAEAWAHEARKLRARQEDSKGQQSAPPPVRADPVEPIFGDVRIYLPIPFKARDAALAAGALEDLAGGWGSRVYVTRELLLARTPQVEALLPRIYTEDRATYRFDPIRRTARGHNLHNAFDRATWARVRSASQEASGNRCVLCGRRSGDSKGLLGRTVDPAFKGTVDCHEMWSWFVSPHRRDIGIQRLDSILVVCRECHEAFHREDAVRRASGRGFDASQVDNALAERQSQIANLPLDQLAEANNLSAARARAQGGNVTWVMDLSHLARQDYMSHAIPALSDRNWKSLGPDVIAGISFRDAGGVLHPPVAAAAAAARLEGFAPDHATVDSFLAGLKS